VKESTRKKQVENEVRKAFEGWAPLLYSKLEAFDYFLEAVQSDLASAGLPFSKSGQFLTEQIIEMNRQIQENKTRKVTAS
jgi:hypothetical protein